MLLRASHDLTRLCDWGLRNTCGVFSSFLLPGSFLTYCVYLWDQLYTTCGQVYVHNLHTHLGTCIHMRTMVLFSCTLRSSTFWNSSRNNPRRGPYFLDIFKERYPKLIKRSKGPSSRGHPIPSFYPATSLPTGSFQAHEPQECWLSPSFCYHCGSVHT